MVLTFGDWANKIKKVEEIKKLKTKNPRGVIVIDSNEKTFKLNKFLYYLEDVQNWQGLLYSLSCLNYGVKLIDFLESRNATKGEITNLISIFIKSVEGGNKDNCKVIYRGLLNQQRKETKKEIKKGGRPKTIKLNKDLKKLINKKPIY